MKSFEKILKEIKEDPKMLDKAFGERLTLKEEFMLGRLESDLAQKVNAILHRAMAGTGPEIVMSDWERTNVLEMTRLQRLIHNLLVERGSLRSGLDCMN